MTLGSEVCRLRLKMAGGVLMPCVDEVPCIMQIQSFRAVWTNFANSGICAPVEVSDLGFSTRWARGAVGYPQIPPKLPSLYPQDMHRMSVVCRLCHLNSHPDRCQSVRSASKPANGFSRA